MRGYVKLKYCEIEGKICPVSKFAHLAPKLRPASTCPECGSLLTLKLGNKNAYHAAHKSDNTSCVLTNPEGALHFNTKRYIFEQLKCGSPLYVKQSCRGWVPNSTDTRAQTEERHFSCSDFHKYLWISKWDDVQIEKGIDSTRPDIVLYRNGNPVAAIEVFVTHAVDAEKALRFHELNIPWVEVKADGEIFDEYFVDWADSDENEDFPWTIKKPLSFYKCFPPPESWQCDRCKDAPRRHEESMAQHELNQRLDRVKKIALEREEEERKRLYYDRTNNKVIVAKAIEITNRDGVQRFDLFIIRRDNNEHPFDPKELYLKNGRLGLEILTSEPITEKSKDKILDYFENVWLAKKGRWAIKVVHLTDWVSEAEFNQFLTIDNTKPSEREGSNRQPTLFD